MTRPQRSRSAESFDPEPNVDRATMRRVRSGHVAIPGCDLDPRPHFEPTRDPLPWLARRGNSGQERYAEQGDPRIQRTWAPRPEYIAEVNPILVTFRDSDLSAGHWLSAILRGSLNFHQPHHIDFARKVLTRLANLNGDSA